MLPLVTRRLSRCLLLGAMGVCASVGAAQRPDGAPLARSPFLPPEQVAGPAPTVQGSWQFSGILGAGPEALYCVVNSETRRTYWLAAGGAPVDGVVVRSFDSANDTLVLQSDGGPTLNLRLQSVQVASGSPSNVVNVPGPSAGNMPAPPGPGNRPGPPGAAAATPASEAERLQAVAEEVRRRRALRQATIEQQRANAAQGR